MGNEIAEDKVCADFELPGGSGPSGLSLHRFFLEVVAFPSAALRTSRVRDIGCSCAAQTLRLNLDLSTVLGGPWLLTPAAAPAEAVLGVAGDTARE